MPGGQDRVPCGYATSSVPSRPALNEPRLVSNYWARISFTTGVIARSASDKSYPVPIPIPGQGGIRYPHGRIHRISDGSKPEFSSTHLMVREVYITSRFHFSTHSVYYHSRNERNRPMLSPPAPFSKIRYFLSLVPAPALTLAVRWPSGLRLRLHWDLLQVHAA
jgi:hypothetical protein